MVCFRTNSIYDHEIAQVTQAWKPSLGRTTVARIPTQQSKQIMWKMERKTFYVIIYGRKQ